MGLGSPFRRQFFRHSLRQFFLNRHNFRIFFNTSEMRGRKTVKPSFVNSKRKSNEKERKRAASVQLNQVGISSIFLTLFLLTATTAKVTPKIAAATEASIALLNSGTVGLGEADDAG